MRPILILVDMRFLTFLTGYPFTKTALPTKTKHVQVLRVHAGTVLKLKHPRRYEKGTCKMKKAFQALCDLHVFVQLSPSLPKPA